MHEVLLTDAAANRIRAVSRRDKAAGERLLTTLRNIARHSPDEFSVPGPVGDFVVSHPEGLDTLYRVEFGDQGSIVFTFDDPVRPSHLVVVDILGRDQPTSVVDSIRQLIAA